MRICIIGYGTTARSHARILRDEGVIIDSVVGRLPEATAAFAKELGECVATTDLNEALVRPGLDAVIVCSPTDLHAMQTEQALRAEMHVLCEIPLATSFDRAQQLTSLARQSGRCLMVAHTHRYQPAIRIAKQRLATGTLHLHSIFARYVFLRRQNVDLTGRKRSWTDNLLWHHGCHATDMCLWLLGVEKPGTVAVVGKVALPDRRMGIPMDLSIVARTPLDQIASIDMSYNSHLSMYDYLLVGHEDSLLISEGKLAGKDGQLFSPEQHGTHDVAAAVLQDREFLASIREGRQPAISGDSVLPAMWLLQQVQNDWDRGHDPLGRHPIGDSA